MEISFVYDEDKDIECLLSKGGGSQNRPGSKTKAYEALLASGVNREDFDQVRGFIREYIKHQGIDIEHNMRSLQASWGDIGVQFEKKAERMFGFKLSKTLIAYLTITGRYPYALEEGYFFVSAQKENVNHTIMHELLHFYTGERFGDEEEKLGEERYNDYKEALTELLNSEFRDLMGGEVDKGYPQHSELRNIVADEWARTKDIEKVWGALKASGGR